ncbi:Imm27 family immunity protein [Thalassotalea fonticola]|uniref:Imm27 family immunity protein n=1 Tax=Thalassotalea fonticola TaxID=3065649 RepID=A0ABZ0GRJ3_9GAMM|nr:Imm27 family immunity protein [Colwelliaceae bacterium S1-1]
MSFNLLQPQEVSLTGSWLVSDGKVKGDDVCSRINWLVENHLQKIGPDKSGWDILFLDPIDNRYWVLFYPQSHLHGGGPKSLEVATPDLINQVLQK